MAYESKCSKNQSHTALYSLIGLQEMNLAYFYPTIFWNCANLIVESGAIEGLDEKTSNYGKIAIAVNKIKTLTDTKVALININNLLRQMQKTILFILVLRDCKA